MLLLLVNIGILPVRAKGLVSILNRSQLDPLLFSLLIESYLDE